MPRTSVAIAKDGSAYELTRCVLDHIGAREDIEHRKSVFVKLNLVRVPLTYPLANAEGAYEKTWTSEGDIVHPQVVEALLRVLREYKVGRIVLGEGAGGCQTPLVFEALGLHQIARRYDAQLIDLNYDDAIKVQLPNGMVLRELWLPKTIFKADFSINLTPQKVHGTTVVSLCLKNWGIGIPPARYYGFPKIGNRLRRPPQAISPIVEDGLPIHGKYDKEECYGQGVGTSKTIIDVCLTRGYDLSLIDGITTVHYRELNPGFGTTYPFPPDEMHVEHTNMMIASLDMVAADAVASRVTCLDPAKILHIKLASERGLGTGDLQKIEIRGEPIEQVALKCNPLYKQREVIL